MKNSRLVIFLRKLDSKEIARLGEMVYSPFFNKDKKCKELYEILIPYAPDFDSPDLERQLIFERLFPEKKKITSFFNTTMSKLLRLINELLLRQELDERSYYKQHLLIKALLKKEGQTYFLNRHKTTRRHMENQPKRDMEFYYESFLVEEDYLEYLQKKEDEQKYKEHLPKVIHKLDTFYFAKKLSFSCELLDLQSMININYDSVLLDNIGEIIAQPIYQENSLIHLYHAVLQILRDEDDEAGFLHLANLLKKDTITKSVTKEVLHDIYPHSLNFCIKKIIKGDLAYNEKLFDLYLEMIDKKLIYNGDHFALRHVKNIISLACQLGKTEWAKEFAETFKKDINLSAYHYFMAAILFYEQAYEATIGQLHLVKEDIDLFYSINAKTLLVRCYYEMNESTAFYNLLQSLTPFLRNNKKISGQWKKAYGNFCSCAYQLFRKKEGFSKKTVANLKERLGNAKQLSHKNWLMEKLNEL